MGERGSQMVEAVIFDMDGLMFDTERVWNDAWPDVLAKFGLTYREGLIEACRATAGSVMDERLAQFYSPDEVDVSLIRKELFSYVPTLLAKGIDKKPGLDEMLAYLDERGLPRAVASSSEPATIARNLRVAGVDAYFDDDAIVSSSQVARSKPAPDVFLLAAERIGARPSRTLVLEDSFNGIRAGRAAGFVTVMVPDREQPTKEILELADACCKDLFEVRDMLAAGSL
ncbi:MAG: HAD family phosphatase [Olsenella sp.]|nr:HAD family phosphatase [Olsenella sp.]